MQANITYNRRGRAGLYDWTAIWGHGERKAIGRVWRATEDPSCDRPWCAVLDGNRMRSGATRAEAVERLLAACTDDSPETWFGWDAWPHGTVCVMRLSHSRPLVLAVDDTFPETWPGAFCVIHPEDED